MTDPKHKNTTEKSLLFEYPLQQNIRSFLRLETLFKQMQRNLLSTNKDNHFHVLKLLFEVLEILERGDTRSELIKELSRLMNYFHALETNPDVETSKLENFLKQIKQLHQWTHCYQGKFGDKIRKHPFIESIKHRTSIPGGSCSFDCPDLYLFLNKPFEQRQKELSYWINDIKGVETSINVILRLVRDNGHWNSEKAPLGSFILETGLQSLRLLRIRAICQNDIYPEFSCGKHRSSIHFMTFNSNHKKFAINIEVGFELACCS